MATGRSARVRGRRAPRRSRLGAGNARSLGLVAIVLALVATLVGAGSVAAFSAPPGDGRVLDRLLHGRDALAALERKGGLDRVAVMNRWSVARTRTELGRDESLMVAPSGRLLYRDVARGLGASAGTPASASAAVVPAAPFPYAHTFALHSRPGLPRVMALDFDGFTNGETGETFTEFDLDGQAGFSNAEMDAIQEIWARVAEAFSAFDVDVTTADPGRAAIVRSGESDSQYGVRLVVGDGGGILATACTPTCIGLAYTPSFGAADPVMDPGGVVRVPNFSPPNVRDVAETAVHELGHTLGLTHTFTAQTSLWAPVMTGALNPAPLGQFTEKGAQDQYAVMAGVGLLTRVDEPSPRAEPAGSFRDTGIISSPTDEDSYTITVPASAGPTTISVTPSAHRPNLDLVATLTDPAAQVLATSDPPATRVDQETATGLDASITANLAPGTYTLAVRGTGLAGVYSSYGSIGSYTVDVTVAPPPPPAGFRITTAALPVATRGQVYAAALVQADGVAPVKWKRKGKLPPGLKLGTKTGVISGTPKKKAATFTFTVEASFKTKAKRQPAVKHTATRVLSITVR